MPVNVTVPACSPERAHAIVAAGGCTTAKVKVAEVGQTLGDDEARLEAVRDALGPGGLIRVDANGGWDVDEAVGAIRLLERAAGGLEYVEQPCADVEELAAVRRAVDVPIAADESIRRAEDPYRVRDLEAADIAVLKVQPLGGVRACLRIAEDIGLPVVVSSAVESSVGIAAGVALAAALPELPHACGLATVQLLTDDVVTEPLLPVDGMLPVRPRSVDHAALDRLGRRPGAGRLVGAPAGRRAAGSALVNPVDRPGPRRRHRAARGRGAARSCSRPARATRRCRSRSTTRPEAGAAPAAHPRRRAHRRLPRARAHQGGRPRGGGVHLRDGRRQPPARRHRGRARRVSTSSSSPPTDRPGCAAPAPTRPPTRSGVFGAFAPTTILEAGGPAVGAVLSATGGPVHLNVQLDEPLRPRGPWTDVPADSRADGRADDRAEPVELPPGPRTVVVAGDDAGPPARVLAQDAGWPLLAEPTSGSRTGDHAIRTYRLLLGSDLGDRVERVVVAGHPTLSRPVTRLLGARGRRGRSSMRSRGIWPARPFAVDRRPDRYVADGRRPRLARRVARGRPVGRPPARRGCCAAEPDLTPYEVAGAVSRALPPEGCCTSAPPARSATST